MFLLLILEPISQGLMHPFVNQMLEEINVTPDRTKIGYYAGIINSLFALSQLCTTFWWGMLSDRVGRKPILLLGLTGLSISMISFSLQSRFLGLVLARCFAGIMDDSLVMVKSMLAELTDDTNKARAFAILPICNAIGMILGPLIGGYLAKPAEQYPKIFGKIGFLIANPYFLPCFLAGMTNLSAAIFGYFFLDETLKSKKTAPKLPLSDESDDVAGLENEARRDITDPRPALSALFTATIVSVLAGSMFVVFQASSWATVIPLFAYTRIEDGGLGLSSKEIGIVLTTNGFGSIIVQTTIFPYFQRRWGTITVFRRVLFLWPLLFALLPVIRWLTKQRREANGAGAASTVAEIGLVCALAIKSVGAMSQACVALLINSVAPSPATFGALNGLGQACSALARTFSPTITGSLFSMSIDKHYLAGNLIWAYQISLSLITLFLAQSINVESDQIARKPQRLRHTL